VQFGALHLAKNRSCSSANLKKNLKNVRKLGSPGEVHLTAKLPFAPHELTF